MKKTSTNQIASDLTNKLFDDLSNVLARNCDIMCSAGLPAKMGASIILACLVHQMLLIVERLGQPPEYTKRILTTALKLKRRVEK